MTVRNGPLRLGIGGPVGAGKTTLTASLCEALRDRYSLGVITNDIYTREDAEALMRLQVLPRDRIIGVETGGCPHTAIREDASINLLAVSDMIARHPGIDLVMIESGGDNLSATFSPELADLTLYVIDTAAGQDIPRKKGPGVARSDLLVVNKTDLAPHVGVDPVMLEDDTKAARGQRPYVMAALRDGRGVEQIVEFLKREGGLCAAQLGQAVCRAAPLALRRELAPLNRQLVLAELQVMAKARGVMGAQDRPAEQRDQPVAILDMDPVQQVAQIGQVVAAAAQRAVEIGL